MDEKQKKTLKRVGKGALYTLCTFGAYLVLKGILYVMPRAETAPSATGDRARAQAADSDPKSGTPLFIGS